MDRGTVVEEKLSFENDAFDRLAELPQPTVTAIGGVALGGGAECCKSAACRSLAPRVQSPAS
jgi:enoyl-CoA hydratase/carnithine racemase